MTTDLTLDEALTPPELSKKEYHLGIIQVSARLAEMWDIQINHTDIQGKLRDDGVFAELHRKLLLPASYSIRGVFYNYWQNAWQICVESPDLPIVPENEEPPVVTPIYNHIFRGMDIPSEVHLKEIRLEDRWKRVYYPEDVTVEQLQSGQKSGKTF